MSWSRTLAVTLFFDRRVPEGVLDLFSEGGEFHPLVDLALEDRSLLDVQLRRQAWSSHERGESWARLYAVLPAVVTIDVNSRGARLLTHSTYQ